jgi:hypothetical protein
MGIALVVGLGMFLLGLAILVGAVVVFLRQRREFANAIKGAGTVVELARRMGQRGYLYHPVVEFAAAPGQTVRFESSIGSSRAGYAVGAPVQVLYDPSAPEKAEIDSAMTRWFYPGCLLAMGAAFTLLGLCLSAMFLLVMMNPQ